jgi:hypothetical protein
MAQDGADGPLDRFEGFFRSEVERHAGLAAERVAAEMEEAAVDDRRL